MGNLEAVLEGFRNDESWNTPNPNGTHRFDKEIAWIEAMVNAYAEALNLSADEVITIMEARRNYSWPNYYQEANFPGIEADSIYGVFETVDEFRDYTHVHWVGFKCPKCGDTSPSPTECIHRIRKDEKCDWCSYGLFESPKGVIIKSQGLRKIPIFEPVSRG